VIWTHNWSLAGKQGISSPVSLLAGYRPVSRPVFPSKVATGAQKEEVDGGSFAFSKDSSLEQKVGKYSITVKDDLLLISEG
jgi:hypothetical protein